MWKKVIAPTVVVSIVWVTTSVWTTMTLARIERTRDKVLIENVASIRAANEMESTVWRMQSLVLNAAPGEEMLRQQWQSLENDFRKTVEMAEHAVTAPDEATLVRNIREAFNVYATEGQKVLASGMSGSGTRPEQLLVLANNVTECCTELMTLNDRLAQAAAERREALTSKLFLMRTLFLIVGPSIGLFLGYRIATGLHRSIMQISIRLKDAAGELQHEVGRLALAPEADLPAVQRQVEVVSERIRHVLQELQQARRDAMLSERLAAVGGLAAGVAHELRNPLTSVKLLIQAAAHRQDGTLDRKTFSVVLEEIERMESTIQNLLDFARPPRLRRARHDVRTTVQRAINLTDGRAKQQRVELRCDFENQPIWVDGDAEQLHQVFVNLLLNGIESMSSGGVLRVSAREDADSQCALIRFVDSGIGIPEPILPHLFEPFVSSKERGTGLGLAVSRRIVQEHSGRLMAVNAAQGGAEFTVELPLALPCRAPLAVAKLA